MYAFRNGQPHVVGVSERVSTPKPNLWTEAQINTVLDGLRSKRTYEDIAATLADERPDMDGKSVGYLLTERFGGLEKFLRSRIADPVEIEDLLDTYHNHATWRQANSGPTAQSSSRKLKAFRPLRDDVLGEREALEETVADGLIRRTAITEIAFTARERGLPVENSRPIEKLIYRYGGIQGFLEHRGLSTMKAREHAEQYQAS